MDFGWVYKFDNQPYIDNQEDIIDFCKNVDSDYGCFGCGFILVFLNFSDVGVQMFYKTYGHFPYDAYLYMWEKFQGYDADKINYNQRNDALSTLEKNNLLSKIGDKYYVVYNPWDKIINRKRNLESLIPDERG